MKRIVLIFSILLVGFFISGCGIEAAKKMIPKMKQPEQQVMANDTKYSVSLQMIGDMLQGIGDPDIYIYIDTISNKTTGVGKVPEDIAGMLKSSFLNMGYKVHIVSNPDLITDKDEAYIIQGEISEFDVVKSEDAGFNLGLYFGKAKGETDASAESGYGYQEVKLGLDLRVLKVKTGEYVPFVFSKNKIIIKRLSDSNKIGFSIAGNGFGLSGSAKVQNGVHESLRLLSEASSVELLGKLRMLPYWLAIPSAIPEQQVINNYKRKFRSIPLEKQIDYIAYLLSKYYGDINDNNFDKYIVRFKREYGVYPPDSKLTPELFAKLLVELPNSTVKTEVNNKRKNLLNSVIE